MRQSLSLPNLLQASAEVPLSQPGMLDDLLRVPHSAAAAAVLSLNDGGADAAAAACAVTERELLLMDAKGTEWPCTLQVCSTFHLAFCSLDSIPTACPKREDRRKIQSGSTLWLTF